MKSTWITPLVVIVASCSGASWPVSESDDPMTDARLVQAEKRGDGGKMALFCDEDGVGVSFTADGTNIGHDLQPIAIRVRYDKSSPEGMSAFADGQQIGFTPEYHAYEKQIVSKIEAGATTLAVEAKDVTGERKVMSFDLAGGRETLSDLRTRCKT